MEQLISLLQTRHNEVVFVINYDLGEVLSASGAFFVGLGALISALISLRSAKKKAEDGCDKRIQDIVDAFNRGTQFAPRESGDVSPDLSDWGGR